MTPADFRAGGNGEAIRFAVGQCSLGAILVAATAKGVCAISLGDDPERLVRDLQDRFRKARADRRRRRLRETTWPRWSGWSRRRRAASACRSTCAAPPSSSASGRRCGKSRPGTTTTYAEIAQRIGAPSAVRAVANASGANPLAVAIPCHRVIRTDGSPSGYRWGVARKLALLSREAAA